MSIVLEVPPALSTELEEQAQRIGVSPQEHATRLLRLATAVGDSAADRLVELDAVLARVDETASDVSPAERERIRSFASWLRRLLIESASMRAELPRIRPERRPSAFGKYRGIIGTSEEYAEFKQSEIDREDRRSP